MKTNETSRVVFTKANYENSIVKKPRKKFNRYVKALSEFYNVAYYIAQKYYAKALGVLSDARMLIRLHIMLLEVKSEIIL